MSSTKVNRKETTVMYEGYLLKYTLIATIQQDCASPFCQYGIQCLAFDESGRLISQYSNIALTSDQDAAERLYAVVTESCVFPVHIDDVLTDSKDVLFAPVTAIA